MDNNEGKLFSKTHLNLKYWGQVWCLVCLQNVTSMDGCCKNRSLLTEEAVVSLHMLMYY